MAKKAKPIPVNTMVDEVGAGIAIEKITIADSYIENLTTANDFEAATQSHRHDRHSFFLLESGTVSLEIDFKTYTIEPHSVIYIHPNQAHHTRTFANVVVSSLAIDNEHLNEEYIQLLENIAPAKPLLLSPHTFSLFSEAVALCIQFSQRKGDRLYHSLLKDSCNALVALILSQYLKHTTPLDKLSRAEGIAKTFWEALERNYTTEKRPAAYAQMLYLSTPYLNECVKNITGHPVSYHIQQRVMLEAKRLLFYSDKTVKEIAAGLGYNDYPYFSRLFTKATGMSAVAFRSKNLV